MKMTTGNTKMTATQTRFIDVRFAIGELAMAGIHVIPRVLKSESGRVTGLDLSTEDDRDVGHCFRDGTSWKIRESDVLDLIELIEIEATRS